MDDLLMSMDDFTTLPVAIFECDEIYFGRYGYKPIESVIITAKALRFVVTESVKLIIPMNHVKETQIDFLSKESSTIIFQVTKQYGAHIEAMLKSAENIVFSSNDKKFPSARIHLVCRELPGCTKNVLRVVLPRISEIEANLHKTILDPTTRPLSELESSSLAIAQKRVIVSAEYAHKESSFEESIDLSANKPGSAKIGVEKVITETDAHTSTQCNDNRNLLTYNYGDGAISISVGDYMCLTSREYLNDKIIDFYMKYIQNNVIHTDYDRKRTHIFSSYFYHVLTFKSCLKDKTDHRTDALRRFERVKNWTKNVNIFEKDFLIIPINENLHWFVIVVCYANLLMPVITDSLSSNNNNAQDGDVIKQPVILIFNSMAKTINYRQTSILRDYLNCEYAAKMPQNANAPSFTKDTLPGHRVKVPQQNNLYDCGVYVLQYIEEFFRKPIKDYRVPINQLSNWFGPLAVVRKREEIAKLIQRLIDEQHAIMGTKPAITIPNIPFPTLNGKLIAMTDEIESVDDNVEMTENKL